MSVDLSRRLAGKIAVVTGRGWRHRAGRRRDVFTPEGGQPWSFGGHRRADRYQRRADELGGLFVPVDVSDETSVNGLYDTRGPTATGSIDIAVNNSRHLASG